MTSKIDSVSTAAISLGGSGKIASEQTASTGVATAQPAAAVDKVSLTSDGVRMQQLDKAVSEAPEIDAGRVASTKAAIAGGRYQVNAQAVAGKLARFEWEMKK